MRPAILLKKFYFWILAGTAALTLSFYYVQLQYFLLSVQPLKPQFLENHEFLSYDLSKEEPLDQEQKCQLPRIHPFDSSVLRYLLPPRTFTCRKRQPLLTFIDEECVLRLNFTAAKSYGYDPTKISCYHQDIIRKDDFTVTYGEKQELHLNGSYVFSDFLYVSCSNYIGYTFYTNMHLHIIPRTFTEKHLRRNSTRHSVLIIGIDSLSRLSFIRQLPKTYKFLKETLNAYIFRGMTKIGDNTFPNLAAILTGKSVLDKELPFIKDPVETYDSWPCLWKNFSKAGYVSFFAEDLPDLNLFNYYRGGFRNAPTDHYMRPFWIAMQKSRLYRFSSHLCFGRTPKHLLQIRYLKDFVSKYSNMEIPFFAFSFFVELSHDYVNEVSLADEDFQSLLKELLLSGHLNRTFLLFLSDHGHRFDSLRETLIGRLEERMPFFAITLPQNMNKSLLNLKHLKVNQGRLTSSYDIYFTLMDILSNSINSTKLGYKTSSRGTTLFGPVFANRTCQMAGIPDHYCTCETEETISNEDPRAREAATVLVHFINTNLLHSHRNQCSLLSLSEIRRTDLILPNQKTVADSRRQPNMTWRDILLEYGQAKGVISKLRVVVQTVPGNALFEGTLLFREDDKSMAVLGDISRINKYGSQSICVKDAILRKYCYCLEN